MNIHEVDNFLREYLRTGDFKDYCPNGLQVEGTRDIKKIAVCVTANADTIKRAVSCGADALFAHHGIFWKGDDYPIVGPKRARISPLIENGLSLFAYHLPLDAHPVIGNNALLAKAIGIENIEAIGPDGLVLKGTCANGASISLSELAAKISGITGAACKILGIGASAPNERIISKVAVCTGGAAEFVSAAAYGGADVFITGEGAERTHYDAEELGISCILCGHEASETFGIKALGKELSDRFGCDCEYLDFSLPF